MKSEKSGQECSNAVIHTVFEGALWLSIRMSGMVRNHGLVIDVQLFATPQGHGKISFAAKRGP